MPHLMICLIFFCWLEWVLFFPIACLLHSYHPKANDFPFVKIVNARQVYYLSLLGRYAALWSALFWLWISCMDFIGSEPVFVGGVIVCCVLLCLNGVFFFYKIYQLRNLVEVEDPEPAIKNEKLLTIGVLVLTAVLGFAMHLLPIWDCMPKILSGILRGILVIAMVVGIVWVCKRYFGLFREIDKDASDSFQEIEASPIRRNGYLFPDNRCDEVSASASLSEFT